MLLWVALFLAGTDGMVKIPAGEFTMGRTRATADDKTNMRPHVLLDDRPARKVFLDEYWIDAKEVTQAQYAEFIKKSGRRAPYHWLNGEVPKGGELLPAYSVNWEDANAYCVAEGKRLPTEAEWEKAARGGKDGMDYPWGDKIDAKQARYSDATGPVAVGKYAPNDYGVFDMAGNVAEWCADWFSRDYYKSGNDRNPKGPDAGMYKVLRGGAWSDSPRRVTVFFRNWVRPNQTTPNIGFRCAR